MPRAPNHATRRPIIPIGQRLVDKKDLTEQEIRTRYITPAIRDDAGWPLHQIREDVYLTDGQIHPRCEHATPRCAEEPPPAPMEIAPGQASWQRSFS